MQIWKNICIAVVNFGKIIEICNIHQLPGTFSLLAVFSPTTDLIKFQTAVFGNNLKSSKQY